MLHIISLGAGVQSSTMALMAARRLIDPMPDCAIFADTGFEPKAIYDYLDYLEGLLPFPVYRVSDGNIQDGLKHAAEGKRWASIPAFTPSGMIRRQCTKEYKLVPIRRKVRQLAGLHGKRSPKTPVVTQWIGISMDEIMRVKPSREDWQLNRHPLIELRMTRRDCLRWMEAQHYRLPSKSACICCPYRDNAGWAEMKQNSPAEFAEAVAVDATIRTGIRNMRDPIYLHRSLKPLDQVDFTAKKKGDDRQLDMFTEECEGMCGV